MSGMQASSRNTTVMGSTDPTMNMGMTNTFGTKNE